MPAVGLGTYPMQGKELLLTTMRAARMGYTSFDTSNAYGNEYYLGWGLMLCGRRRKNLFITTKLSNKQQRTGDVRKALQDSLTNLHTDYVDLYLMHWPNPDTYLESWKQMENIYEEGLARAIGVCNFHQHHLETLLAHGKIVPAVNQIERHPLLSQKPLLDYCKQKGIAVTAYSPLARMHDTLIHNPALEAIAKAHGKSVTQIILRWDIQCGIATIPKTANKARLKENISLFDFALSEEEMNIIDGINQNFRVRHDPDNCDFSML